MPELHVRRDDLATCRVVEGEPRREDLGEGEAQLLVERLALSANNVTYARLGDRLGYWRLFPAPEGWGRIPAWGEARVVASRSPALTEGARFSGVVPVGRYMTVHPSPGPVGFMDAAPHRAGLPPVYNRYLPVEGGAGDAALVMRPLFGTSMLLDLMLADRGFEGARTVVLTSASSRTAYGLAHLLGARPVETVGLTSGARREWVEGLGLYDAVLSYDELGRLTAPGGALLVDFAGDQAIVRAVRERLGDAVRRSVLVGFTHGRLATDEAPLAGPVSEFFFAPDEIVRRGRAFARSYADAWQGFAPVADRLLRIERISDSDHLVRVYRDLLAGRADPAVGYVASL